MDINKISSPPDDVGRLVDFKMFSGPVAIIKNADGSIPVIELTEEIDNPPRIIGIGSSECEDLAGDRMLKSALEDMCEFSVGSGIWLNHKYDLPEDLFGMLSEPPRLVVEQPNGFGPKKADKPYYAVELTIDAATTNKRAVETLKYLKKGIKIGISIGCQINDFDVRKDAKGAISGLDIKKVTALEFSTVGIPANAQSWVREAVKGLRRKGVLPEQYNEQAYAEVLRDWSDFDPKEAVVLRRINEVLSERGLCIAALSGVEV